MAETLHVIITAENKEAIKAIQDTIKGTEGLQTQFKKVGSASNEANQALINSGRVLQDLNYGIIGIANNLNPLLESYQRLGDKTKDNSSVSKELKSALMGPAGIGVALSAITFLLLKYGDAIGETIEKIVLGRNELREQTNALESTGDGYKKAYIEVEKLGTAFDAFNNGTKSKKEVLDEYNKTLGNVYGHTKDINEAESVYRANTDGYINAAMLRAAAEYEYKKAAEEASKAAEARAKPTQTFTPFGIGVSTSLTYGQNYGAVSLAAKAAQNDVDSTHTKAANFFLGIAKDFDNQANLIIASGKKTKTYGEETAGKLNEVQNILKSFNESWKANEVLLSRGRLFAESGPKSYALSQLEAIDKAIKALAGKDTKEAENAINSLLSKEKDIYDKFYSGKPQVSRSELDTSIIAKEGPTRNLGNLFGGSETKLDATRTAREKAMLDLEANRISAEADRERQKENTKLLKKQQQDYESFANTISNTLTNAFMGLFDAMERGANIGEALEDMFKNLAKQIAASVIQALLFKAIMNAISGGAGGAIEGGAGAADLLFAGMATGGIVNKPTLALIGEGSESEAVMPLSKLSNFLNTSFNAGAMSGGTTSNGGQFVLRGQDLLLAINRSQKASNIKGQSISLA